ncbi:excalibur calcium-binding domain-containing protein [Aurantiacibacter zhengii]|uniref:YHYH domain-containing protein n=1 Tax=Aurantiacibacter zhengii TaxID=2307003 RepID=A0A418NSI2_9SPHN|nr:excalibur calcium-binding domain-containing protein [Aurantiacibacter zhengii]RIV86021.1 YHYH domain-containing protein [Aurantiacibacter zhengii]
MLAVVVSGALFVASPASGHGGRLAADGCHNDRKTGTRHCHRATSDTSPQADQAQRQPDGSVYYRNCDAARAAGAAPVRRGQPGYARHLDRDGDGVGCET